MITPPSTPPGVELDLFYGEVRTVRLGALTRHETAGQSWTFAVKGTY